jgi:hypothetical protein
VVARAKQSNTTVAKLSDGRVAVPLYAVKDKEGEPGWEAPSNPMYLAASPEKVMEWLAEKEKRPAKKPEKVQEAESKVSAPRKAKSKKSFKADMERRRKDGLVLTGNTYAIREQIKAAGGVWDRYEKAWLMPSRDAMQRMKTLMHSARAPQGQAGFTGSQKQPSTRAPSPKQVNYAMSLIERLKRDDYGTFTTYGYQTASHEKLSKMSAADVSAIIDHIRDEMQY